MCCKQQGADLKGFGAFAEKGKRMSIISDVIRTDKEYRELLHTAKLAFSAVKPLRIAAGGLCDGASDAAVISLISDLKKEGHGTALIVCAEEKECVRTRETLERFGLRAAFYCPRDLNLYNITASHDYEHERLGVLFGLSCGMLDAVVTTPDAALGFTVPPAVLDDCSFKIDFDTVIDIADLSHKLCRAGYARVEMVDSAGQFAVRGGIIDIFPPYCLSHGGELPTGSYPFRIELFGDEVDRIGAFDPETQRFVANVDAIEFPPAREVILTPEKLGEISQAIAAHFKRSKNEEAMSEMVSEISAIDTALQNGETDVKFADKYLSLIYPEKVSLLDYFDKRTLVILRSANAIADRLSGFEWHSNQLVKDLLEGGTIAAKFTEYAKPVSEFEHFLSQNVTLHTDSLLQGLSGMRLGGVFTFRTKHVVTYADKYDLLLEDISNYVKNGFRLILIAENETSAKNLAGLLRGREINAVCEVENGDFTVDTLGVGTILVKWREYLRGFELAASKFAVLTTNPDSKSGNLALSNKLKSRSSRKKKTRTVMTADELEVGDYVVHDAYGIGIYRGIENLTIDGISRDYISIQYAGSDKLFLPTEKLDMVSKYIGARSEDGIVKLSKFGGGEWGRAKNKAKAAVKDIAKDLIKLYAERMRREGYAFPEDDDLQLDFDTSFLYDETSAQIDAIADIKEDMMKPTPMDRLLCGDVGYGKTEVAFRAAYKAVLGGKQVAILVPTTILAMQHFQTAMSRMRGFGVEIDMISRFRTPKQIAHSLRKLARGETDIIIGTHRLISKDVEFKDLGLLIVDEEQRFGVSQKEKLKQLTGNIDVLTLTATPIPRTLNMAMGGIRDISVLDEAPTDRLPVQTYVLEDDELIIMEAIRRELRRGGQVFYMHNFIDSITSVAARVKNAIPDAKIKIAHGKMEREQLEDIWNSMLTGETDVLISTSIIETGIDVPNANTLIVDNAHRLGLSQLHQLRGRVGRSSRRAYAYFTYPKNLALTEISQKRLEAIRDYAEFGAGFKIAMRDLELRGAGNLLGSQQHGHLDAVGYDLYIRLLNEAVLEEKGIAPKKEAECKISLAYDAYLPDSYVKHASQRMALYKRIALIRNKDDYYDITDELIDRYGELPKPAKNLLLIALIRGNALECGIEEVADEGQLVNIYPTHIDIDVWSDLSDEFEGALKIVMSSRTHIAFSLKKNPKPLEYINKIFEKYLEFAKKEE